MKSNHNQVHRCDPQIRAEDPDECDAGALLYSVGGEGAEGEDPVFSINPLTGDLLLLKVKGCMRRCLNMN